jgi:hypothetical protein
VPPDDFFDEDWEEPSRTQDTAITRPAGEPAERTGDDAPPTDRTPRTRRPPPRRKPARRGLRMPQISGMPKLPKLPRPSGGAASLPPLEYRRLAVLGAGILVVVLALVLLARSCSGTSTKSANESYVATLTTSVLRPSDKVASRFHKTLDLPRASLALLRKRFATQLAAMRGVQTTAQGLKPTKQLAPYQSALLQSLEFRVIGLQCMSENIGSAWKVKKPLAAGAQLSPCMGQLLTSDYVYADSFANGANTALKDVGATGVPTSQFLRPSDINLVTPAGIGATLQRQHPGPVKGLHGTQMGSVVASPQGLTLQPGTINQVKGKDLVFVVSVKNSGHSTEVGVKVQLKLKRVSGGGTTILKTARISSVAAGATAQVRFPGLFASQQTAPVYSAQYKLTVTSLKVPGEKVLTNNTSSYIVEFILS